MTTAVVETVKEVEVFRHQAQMIREVVRRNVDSFTQEESLLQPAPAGNCQNWVVGHLLCIYNQVLPLLGQEPVLEKDALAQYARGSSPLADPAAALDFQQLLTSWAEANERIHAGLASLTAEALDRPAPHSPSNTRTRPSAPRLDRSLPPGLPLRPDRAPPADGGEGRGDPLSGKVPGARQDGSAVRDQPPAACRSPRLRESAVIWRICRGTIGYASH